MKDEGPQVGHGPRRALVLANGPVSDPAWIAREIARSTDWLVVAADGGFAHAGPLRVSVRVQIGDLDSAPPGVGPDVLRIPHPRDKDETDLELALAYVRSIPAIRELVIVGALGARIDHSLTNVDVAARMAGRGRTVRLVDGSYRLHFVQSALTLTPEPRFDTISLLPHSRRVRGIVTRGLAFPLAGETLHRGRGRGVSNALVGRRATVRVEEGLLMVVETSSR